LLATTTLGLGSVLTNWSVTTTSTSTTAAGAAAEFNIVVLFGLETEKFSILVGASSHGVALMDELGSGHLAGVLFDSYDVLGIELFVLADFVHLVETCGLGLLGKHVVIESETNFFFNNGLGLGLLFSGLALSGLLFSLLGLLTGDFTLGLGPLSVTAIFTYASSTSGTVLTVHGVTFFTGLTLKSGASATTSFSAFRALFSFDNDNLTVFTEGHSSSGSITTATSLTVTTATSLAVSTTTVLTTATSLAVSTTTSLASTSFAIDDFTFSSGFASGSVSTSTVTTATDTSLATAITATATRATTLDLGTISNLLEFLTLSIVDGGFGDLYDDLLLGFGLSGVDLDFLDLSGHNFLISECSESIWFHLVCSSKNIRLVSIRRRVPKTDSEQIIDRTNRQLDPGGRIEGALSVILFEAQDSFRSVLKCVARDNLLIKC
jgi:hypothetical protein